MMAVKKAEDLVRSKFKSLEDVCSHFALFQIKEQQRKIAELSEALKKSQEQLLQQQVALKDQQSKLNMANNNANNMLVSGHQVQFQNPANDRVIAQNLHNQKLLVQNQQLQNQIEQLQAMQLKVQEHQAAVKQTLAAGPSDAGSIQQQRPEVVPNVVVK